MKTLIRGTATALALLAGVTIATAQTSTTVPTTAPSTGAAVLTPEEQTAIRQYVAKERHKSVSLPNVKVEVGSEVPSSVELYSVPNVSKYKLAVINDQTVIVDPDVHKIVQVIRPTPAPP